MSLVASKFHILIMSLFHQYEKLLKKICTYITSDHVIQNFEVHFLWQKKFVYQPVIRGFETGKIGVILEILTVGLIKEGCYSQDKCWLVARIYFIFKLMFLCLKHR